MSVTLPVRTRFGKSELGQFFTAPPIAAFMAEMFRDLPPTVRLLDAGAGTGALTAAFVEHICERPQDVQTIEASLYEIDSELIGPLTVTMNNCLAQCKEAGVRFSFTIHHANFIIEMSRCLAGGFFETFPSTFDAAIVNPPYRKMNSSSVERRALHSLGIETSNLYSGFIALVHRVLKPGGQLVAITPRSFCNGNYFRAFRDDLLRNVSLRRLHIFESRTAAFRDDSVLQENIIFHAVKMDTRTTTVVVSVSDDADTANTRTAEVPFDEIVHPNDHDRFIHIPSTKGHIIAGKRLMNLKSNLASLGVTVSTGRVVDFRLKDALHREPTFGTVPLLYSCHFQNGTVHWPNLQARKPNAILDNDMTRPWLTPSGLYLLTKRFTSKEERRRIVAFLFEPERVQSEWIGFENHLNYFHQDGQGLQRDLALGLYAYLNSTIVDQFFRRFSGHTQVNAADLRSLPYPSIDTVKSMGQTLKTAIVDQHEIDQLVARHLYGGE